MVHFDLEFSFKAIYLCWAKIVLVYHGQASNLLQSDRQDLQVNSFQAWMNDLNQQISNLKRRGKGGSCHNAGGT